MSAVASVASTAAVAAPSIAPTQHPDRELLDMVDRYFAAAALLQEASNKIDELEPQRDAALPELPSELKRRNSDALGVATRRLPDGHYYSFDAIDELREKPRMMREFIGTDEQWSALPDDRPAPPEMQHLFADVIDEKRQRRAEEIIAAADRYREQIRAVEVSVGYDQAVKISDERFDVVCDLEQKIYETPAGTIDGLKAKARIVCRLVDDDLVAEDEDWSVRVALGLIADLRQMVA